MRDNQNYQSRIASQRDRISNILSKQSQPQPLSADIGNISQAFLSALSQNTGAAGFQQAYNQNKQQDFNREMDIYNLMQDEIKQGNEDAAAVDKAIRGITGNDPVAYSKIASELHNYPNQVDRTNANLLASRAAAKMGYKPLAQSFDELDLQYKRAQIEKASRPDPTSGGGATGVIIGNIMRDNPGMTFTQALQMYQTGFRSGTRINPETGEVETIPGYLGTREQIKAAETKGAEIGKKQGELGTKEIAAPQILDLTSEARKLLPKASSGSVSAVKTDLLNRSGISTEQSQADAQLDIIAAGLVSNVPRMEGPQSDADTRLYREAAGNIGNRSLPYETRLAALDQLERITKKYSNVKKRFKYNLKTGKVE